MLAVFALAMATLAALTMVIALSMGSPGLSAVEFLIPLLTAVLAIGGILLNERGSFAGALIAVAFSLAIIPVAAAIYMPK